MKIVCREIETIQEFIDAIRIRVDIFIIEQKGPPGWEPDDLDKNSSHFVALVKDEIVGTVRLREDPKGVAKFERMAVTKKYRDRGIGLKLTSFVIGQAKNQGCKKIWMQAQKYTKGLYEKAGFKTTSKPYDLWNLGIRHIDMELDLRRL
ncbi:hypothetical protein A2866_06610 [Candidatus Roizmanbacteria bacterium RIFCSPHIGHO2_01_FULL_39_8]|uniref:N-acetyltransferase domain-containing protein n=2 Tax=Candidatus Roizmaniibacteriota TaxID=1752723 RepID=A0A1F7GH75_9BACT|nr:MAG: hypothetical protein A2866_06610 [Candidatus Roizmanbacteria bacterium RIFCSPHIGHO2_01_FULL_39_8]OGK27568.1 MAG: hypothetical protein A3C28_06075 [Candidatus Roizmanbacteria bacterium RIFCSPHIGHO2_02_FULL_39_9]